MGNIYTGSNSGKAGLNVKKADNTVDVFGVSQIQLGGNMTLVNNQNGSVTIDSTGGGGSGGVTELSFGSTGFLPATSQTGSIVMTGELNVTSGGTGLASLGTAEQILKVNAGGTALEYATLTEGTGITIAEAAGTITITADNNGTMSSFRLTDGSNSETVGDGDPITFTGGTGLTSVVSAPDTVTFELDDTAVTAATYTNATLTVDGQGRLTSASSGTAPATGTGVANQVAFWDSASTITGDTGLTYVSTAGSRQLKITDTGVDDMLVIESTDNDDTNAPDIKLYRNSNSPTTDDLIGAIKFNANEGNTFTELTYARIESRIDSAGLATYGGSLDFYITNDTQEVRMLTISGETSGVPNMSFDVNPDGDVDGDFRHFSLGGTVNIFSDSQTRTLDIAPIKNYGFGGTSTPLEGELLIGNGTTFSKSSLTSTGGTIIFDVSTTPGTINLETAGGGGGTPAGSNTEIQFNNGGAFGASSALTFNTTTSPPLFQLGDLFSNPQVPTQFKQNAGSTVIGPPVVTTLGGSITSSTSEISLGFNSGFALANELHGLKLQPTDYQVKTGKTTTQSFGQTQNTIIGTGGAQVVDCYPSQGGLIVVVGSATAITINLTLGQFAAPLGGYDSGALPFQTPPPANTSNLAGYGTWAIGDQVTVLANLTAGQVPNIVIRSYNSVQNGSLGVPSTEATSAPADDPSVATKINGVLSDSTTSPAGVKTITTNYTALTFILCQAQTGTLGVEWVAIG